jgi:putative flippase GtrA
MNISVKNVAKLAQSQVSRYLIIGMMTTAISFGSFGLLIHLTAISPHLANSIAVLFAVIFAYFANKIFVFRTAFEGIIPLSLEMIRYLASRAVAMIVEIAGVYLLMELIGLLPMPAKALISLLVIVFNYLAFRYFVFRQKQLSENGRSSNS